jgi:hypothetical protein
MLKDSPGFLVLATGQEIAEQSIAKKLGFADVKKSSDGIDHAVDTGRSRHAF